MFAIRHDDQRIGGIHMGMTEDAVRDLTSDWAVTWSASSATGRRVHGRSRILSLVLCSETVTALRDLSDAGRRLRGVTERWSTEPPG
jgi:hypothetical protein